MSLNRAPKGFSVPALRGEKCRAPAEGSKTEKLVFQGSKTVNKVGAVLESLGTNNARALSLHFTSGTWTLIENLTVRRFGGSRKEEEEEEIYIANRNSTYEVMRIKDMITQGKSSLYFNNLSKVAFIRKVWGLERRICSLI